MCSLELTAVRPHIRIETASPTVGTRKHEVVMQRRRFKQIKTLEERLTEQAKRLREEAKLLPPGAEREGLIRRARQAETGSHVSEWLRSPGLQPPK